MHTLKVIDTTFLTMCPFDGQMMGKWTVTVKVPENVKQVAHQLFDELNKSKYPAEIVNFKIENGNCRPLWPPKRVTCNEMAFYWHPNRELTISAPVQR